MAWIIRRSRGTPVRNERNIDGSPLTKSIVAMSVSPGASQTALASLSSVVKSSGSDLPIRKLIISLQRGTRRSRLSSNLPAQPITGSSPNASASDRAEASASLFLIVLISSTNRTYIPFVTTSPLTCGHGPNRQPFTNCPTVRHGFPVRSSPALSGR